MLYCVSCGQEYEDHSGLEEKVICKECPRKIARQNNLEWVCFVCGEDARDCNHNMTHEQMYAAASVRRPHGDPDEWEQQ